MRVLTTARSILAAAVVLTAALTLTACGEEEPAADPTPTATGAPAIALDTLLTIEVPALCEHPAGTLVDGMLPGISENDGRVMLGGSLVEEMQSGATESAFALTGTDAEGEQFLAASVYCDRGGVAWPNQVVVWDAELAPVGVFEPFVLTGGDREVIVELGSAENGFFARWTAPTLYDPSCCFQLSAESTVKVDVAGAELTLAAPVLQRGETQVRAVFEAALAGTTAPDVTAADGLYEGITLIAERGGEYDFDGIACNDVEMGEITLACGIPVKINGEDRMFVVYPQMKGWGAYDIPKYSLELW
ncbi:hypothetical protein [Microbacterium sp. A84]|uniref:hypothetical protein n=1 Tax=Microbacterium sp. A84 TaxID=3450715 RepID=UPI003F433375